MADTTFATGSASTVKRWARKWWMAAKAESFFYSHGFVGPENEGRYIIVEQPDLMKDQGDVVHMGQWQQLTGAGISGDNALEGSEEAMVDYTFDITIDQKRNAIRLNGRMTEQRHADEQMRAKAKILLQTWLANKIDVDIFTALSTSPTKVIYGGTANSTATIAAGDYITLNLISKAIAMAKKATPLIQAVPIKGKEYYVAILSPDCAYDLTEQESRWEQAQREAGNRGDENRLFQDSLGNWKGCILHEHQNVTTATNWGSGGNVNGAVNLFLGVGAAGMAYAKRKTWFEKEFDYGNKYGFAVGSIYGVAKAVFNSADHAVIAIDTNRSSN